MPKVIDFGVAKATGGKLTERTMFTQFGQLVGTLEYMSPEQATFNALDVDTRSDVYSLGVLLYELLAGSTPFERERLRGAAFDEVLRIIREEEPPKPSTRLSTTAELPGIAASRKTEPAKLGRIVKGDLDWIVMKALEKDRSRRYETANGFALDLQRHLDDEPVQARPPSAAYRARKFVRRNKGAVITVGLLTLALVAGTVGTSVGLLWALEERGNAKESAGKAEEARVAETAAREKAQAKEAETRAVLDFVTNRVFAAARPEGQDGGLGHDVPLRRAVETALAFIETDLKDRPLTEAQLRAALGTTFHYLGDDQQALEQLKRVRALHAAHLSADDPDALWSMTALGRSYHSLGRFAEALPLYEQVLPLKLAKYGPDHSETFGGIVNVALCYAELGRRDEAIRMYEAILPRMRAKLPDHRFTFNCMHNLARAYHYAGRAADALRLDREALELRKAKLGPTDPDVFASLMSLALDYKALHQHDEALRLDEEVIALQKAKLGPTHIDTVMSLYNAGLNRAQRGRNKDALPYIQEAFSALKAKFGPGHERTLASHRILVEVLIGLDRLAEAEPLIEDYVRHARDTGGQQKYASDLVVLRFRSFEKRGDVAGCRKMAEAMEKLSEKDAGGQYDAACMRSLTAALITARERSPHPSAESEVSHALRLLRQARDAGWRDVKHMKEDADLAILRERSEFKKLVSDLEAKPK